MSPIRHWWIGLALLPALARGEPEWVTRSWRSDDGLPNNHVTKIASGPDGAVWVETQEGAARFDGARFAAADVPGSPLGALEDEVAHGTKAVVGRETWQVRGDVVGVIRAGKWAPMLTRRRPRIAPARRGGLWVASGAQLLHLGPHHHLTDYGSFPTDGPHPQVLALFEDSRGAVWIGTATNGLFRFADGAFQKIETSYAYVMALAEDAEHNVWAGTDGGGLDRISQRFIRVERFAGDGSSAGIQSLCEDRDGTLWGVTQNRWLVVRGASGWQLVDPPALRAIDAPLCVTADRQGGIWIGTATRALYHWQRGQLQRWNAGSGLASYSVHSLLAAKDGTLWVGEYNPDGVQRLQDGNLSTVAMPSGMGAVRALCEDAAGAVWVGTDGGLLRAEAGGELVTIAAASGPEHAVRCLHAVPDGSVWVAYAGAGLARLRGGRLAAVGPAQGLPDGYISQMALDRSGWLWLGSADKGIFKVRLEALNRAADDPAARVRPVLYGRNEGLLGLEAYGSHSPDAIAASAICSRDGAMLIPMRTGLAVVMPDREPDNVRPPVVRLMEVEVDGHRVELPARLPPTHRKVEFDFSAVNLSSPENIHVRYRLDGIDPDWTETRGERPAEYSRLAPGTYRFRLEGANFDGPWTASGPPASITVRPFFWQTWWFDGLVVAGCATAAAGIVRRVSTRRLRAANRALEQQAALSRERARIARDLHDDLGGSITQALVMLDLARREEQGAAGAKFGACLEVVRNAAASVDEIIWATSPRHDTLPALIDYLAEQAVERLHAAGIECNVDLPETLPDAPLAPEARHHLYLSLKECVSNVVRHAGASEVRLRVAATAAELSIDLEDNGRGFDFGAVDSGADGLRNIRQRLTEIGGRIEIESHPGAGTRVALRYPLTCP